MRTYTAISTSQHFINTFVSVAAQNRNKMSNEDLADKVIYNYDPKLTDLDYTFLQIYIFDEDKEIKEKYGSFEGHLTFSQ